MGATNIRKLSRIKRKKRIRKKLTGTADKPRMSVFRSSKHIYAQLVDDINGNTLVSACSLEGMVKEQPDFDSKVALAVPGAFMALLGAWLSSVAYFT